MLFAQLCGGLGNQMFQYAYARALGERLGEPLCLDLSFYNAGGEKRGRPEEISPLFRYNIRYDELLYSWGDVHARCGALHARYEKLARYLDGVEAASGADERYRAEKRRAFAANVFGGVYLCNDRYIREYRSLRSAVYCAGYRQSERYFESIAGRIRAELALKTPVPDALTPLYGEIRSSEAVCVHVRRGDYVKLSSSHLVCSPRYYLDAARTVLSLAPGARCYVFSDDPAWTRANVPLEDAVYVSGGHADYEELRLMSACRHFVLSNSSFSWWAQYLGGSPGRVVAAPDMWYPDGKKTDIYQSFWRLIGC